MTKINDSIFGQIEYKDNEWIKTIDISLFGREKTMDIIVEDDNKEGILDVQRNAFVLYNENLSIYKETVPLTLLQYFLFHFKEINKVVILPKDAKKSTIKAERLFQMFKIMSLLFDRKGNFGWFCRFSWEEVGLVILLSEETPRILTTNQFLDYRKLEDPVFGEMVFNEDVWERNEQICVCGKEMTVEISTDDCDGKISEIERNSYENYKMYEMEYFNEIPSALLSYYLANYENVKEMWRIPRQYNKNNINKDNIMDLIDFKELYIDEDGQCAWLCECPWEEDDGIAFLLSDGQVRVELQTDIF